MSGLEIGPIRHRAESAPPEAIPDRVSGGLASRDLDQLTARELMTPGVVAIVEDASLDKAFKAMAAHGKHAILVVGASTGHPLGWATDRGLLGHLEQEAGLTPIRDAVTEEALSVTPGATARQITTMLSRAGTTHVLVAPAAGRFPEGVVSALDLIRAAGA